MKLVDGNSLKKFYNLIKRVFVTQKEFTEKLDGKANNIHTHDNRYYTESEVDNKLSTKSPIGHTHSANDVGAKESDWLPDWEDIQNVPYAFDPKLGTTSTTAFRGDRGNLAYQHSLEEHAPSDAQKNSDITKSEIEAKLTGIIASHNHNGQYYTEAEIDGMMTNKADVNHRHTPEELGAISPDWNGITNKPKTFPPTLGNTEVTAFRGDYGEIAYSHSQEEHAPIHAQKNSDITKSEIEAKLTGDIKTHDHNTNYFTKSEIESQMTDKSDITHNHDGMYIDDPTLTKRLTTKADLVHAHTADEIGAMSADYIPTWDTVMEKPNTFPPILGNNSSSAFRGDYGNIAYLHSQSEHAPIHAQKNSDITKDEIEEKLTGEISSHSHNGQYFTEAEVKKLLDAKAELEHLHEEYITSLEMNNALAGKANVKHAHTVDEIGGDLVVSTDWEDVIGKPLNFPPILGNSSTSAFRGDYGNTAYQHSQSDHAPADAQKNSDITKAEIEEKLVGDINSHNHNGQYFTEAEIKKLLENKAELEHLHEDYVTLVTMNNALAGKANVKHAHTVDEIGGDLVVSTDWEDVIGKPATFTPTLGTSNNTAFRGDHGNVAYQHAQSDHAPADAQKNSDVTKAEIEAKLTGTITSHNHNNQYYSKSEIDDQMSGKSATGHTHPSLSHSGTVTIHADNDASGTSEYAMLKAGHNELKVTSSGGGKTETRGQDKLTFNGHVVYHAGKKPTATDVGARPNSWLPSWSEIDNKPATFAPTLGTSNVTAFRGDYGNTAYQHAQSDHAPSDAQKNSDITKEEIEAKLTGSITTHNHNGQYYSRADMDNQMANKSDTNHTHNNYVPKTTVGNITIHADNDASTTTEFAMLKAGHNELKVTSSGGGGAITKGQDKLTFNGNVVYHAGKKPTAIDVGARPNSWVPAWTEIDNKPPTFTPTLGTTATTAFRGDYGNAAYIHSQSAHAPSTAQKNSDITKGEIEARLTGTITSHNHNGQYYTEAEVDGMLSGKANVAHGVHVPAPQSLDNAKFLRNDNSWQTVSPQNIKAVAGDYKSATTPATSRWYIIAETESVDQSNTIGTFIIRSAVSGKHSSTILNAGITYGSNPILQQISHTAYTVSSITKARIAYHTTYSGHRAYLEVFVPDNTAREIDVQLIGNSGWRLVSPDTIGGLLAGYISYEKTLVVGKMVSDINGKVNGCNLTYENGDFYLSND